MKMPDMVGTFAAGVVSTTSRAVRHPVCTAARAAGMVKGATGAGVDLVRGRFRDTGSAPDAEGPGTAGAQTTVPSQRSGAAPTPPAAPATTERVRDLPGPDVVGREVPDPADLPEPLTIEVGDETGEAFHTEPKASSRDSEHGGQAGDREEAEGYLEEIPDEEDDLVVYTSESSTGETGSESVFDEAAAHAVRSESEMLRRAAEREPE